MNGADEAIDDPVFHRVPTEQEITLLFDAVKRAVEKVYGGNAAYVLIVQNPDDVKVTTNARLEFIPPMLEMTAERLRAQLPNHQPTGVPH